MPEATLDAMPMCAATTAFAIILISSPYFPAPSPGAAGLPIRKVISNGKRFGVGPDLGKKPSGEELCRSIANIRDRGSQQFASAREAVYACK